MDGRGFKFSLLFGIVTCFLSGTGLPARDSPPTYVNELRGRLVLLPINIPPGKTVDKIKWDFYSQMGNNTGYQIAEISNGILKCIKACGQFEQRIEMVNEITLRINDLKMEDSGLYNAHVRFNGIESPKYSFNLTVHAPVPKPQITLLKYSKTSEGFNVTLQCLAPGEEKIDISWGREDPINSDWQHLSGNGTVLQLFWQPGSTYSTITCQASNPVDQKNASYDLNSIPKSEGANLPLIIFGSLVAFVLIAAVPVLWRKREALKPKFQKVFCHRNSTPNAIELQKVVTPESASLQNGYAKCLHSEPDEISDSTLPLNGPLENS